jgi:hypothetical protein
MNLDKFQSFLDTVASMQPEYMPAQKLRILNSVAILQKEGILPTETRLIDNLSMDTQTFNRLAIELVNEGLLKAFVCSPHGDQVDRPGPVEGVCVFLGRGLAPSYSDQSQAGDRNLLTDSFPAFPQNQSKGTASLRNNTVRKKREHKPIETVH